MTRTENDLRAALLEMEHRADEHGAPSPASILAATTDDRPAGRGNSVPRRRFARWLPPVAAAAVVAATAVTAATLSTHGGASSHPRASQAGGQPPANHSPAHRTATAATASPARTATTPAAILDDAAAALDAAPNWTTPPPTDFFYVRTTEATTWTSVSGRQPGRGRSANGTVIWVPGCAHGRIVSTGESGTCTVNDVPHYLADAPTVASPWDAYLEHIAPGSKAADAQGKIIVDVLHQDLVAPRAAAALLRYTTTCPGLHTLTVPPVAGQNLIGVTCTSMTNGSYGLVFDATSHHLVGFVVLASTGQQQSPAEIIRQTGIVASTGRTP